MKPVESFFIKIIFKDEKNRTYLKSFVARYPNIIEKINKTNYIIQNNGVGLFLIFKLIEKFHPFIWIYAMEEFMEFQIPEKIKEVVKCKKNLTEKMKTELMNIKYYQVWQKNTPSFRAVMNFVHPNI